MTELWISAAKALSLVTREVGGEWGAMEAICTRAHAGLLNSQAELFVVGETRSENALIPADFWRTEGPEGMVQEWSRGDFTLRGDSDSDMRAFGVQFDFEGIRKLLSKDRAIAALRELSTSGSPALAPELATGESQSRNIGGRPPKEFWDDLWCAIWADLYHGDFKPRKQAEIERAMKDWVQSQGETISDTAVRARARKLFAAITREDNKPAL